VHDYNRLESIIVIEGVEQPQLLAAMHAIEGVVGIEHDAQRHLPKRGAILFDKGLSEPQQSPPVGQVFQSRDRRLRAQIDP
jgi:hypothetical protein